jgi:hypothetical protein
MTSPGKNHKLSLAIYQLMTNFDDLESMVLSFSDGTTLTLEGEACKRDAAVIAGGLVTLQIMGQQQARGKTQADPPVTTTVSGAVYVDEDGMAADSLKDMLDEVGKVRRKKVQA